MSNNDVVNNINNGYALWSSDVYSPNLIGPIAHSFVRSSDFCIVSSTAEVYVYDSRQKQTNVFEFITIMTYQRIVLRQLSYTRDAVLKLISKDISWTVSLHHSHQIMSNNKSTVQFINNQVYYQNNVEILLMSTPSNILHVHLPPPEITLQQISTNRITFDYLSHIMIYNCF